MKILFIWDGDYPWDIRVEKVCTTLVENHHEIHMVCRNKKRQNLYEVYNGLHIHRLKYLPKFFGKLNNLFTFPAFFSLLWIWEIYQQAKNNKCELIIVRDLPMSPAGILVGKLLRIPIVLDMAECYPEMLRCTWLFERKRILNIFTRNPYVADMVEYYVLKHINHIIVMIEESKERLIKKHINPNNISIVSNTPIIKNLNNIEYNKNINKNELLTLLYVGLLNPSRGIDTVLEAVKEYVKYNKKFIFWVVGEGKDKDRLINFVKQNGLDNHVIFYGWVDNIHVPMIIHNSDICIVPHHKCSHWDNTIPNKMFDYMALGKPIIVTNVTPMQRIVTKEKCGYVYEDMNSNELVNKIRELENIEIRNDLGNNGRKAIGDRYNWNRDEKVLIEVVHKLKKVD